ncbi:MAG: exodeoxyribonuclease VII large subunit [Gammaproteobacteria bacterium]|nr:exodeoxyribonuclease VII large subunit [Gammaproteobacteria bacterium]
MSIARSDSADRLVLTPSQLNSEVRQVLEQGFPVLWVEGEISNLAEPRSGHLYFSLKDASAQVRCAMFRNRKQLLRFQPANGQQVLLRARISVYEPRGEYQLIVDSMEEAGHGALQRAFEELKARLSAEGLFAAERKQPLPAFPRRIGIVTSPSGAAIRDMLATFRRRFAGLEIVVYPSQVQGATAPQQLVRAIEAAGERQEVDLLIVSRGGGSLEDLMAFNDEAVARAIAACPLPTVSGVGHEVDVTIADFVADVRAATPTAAAELVSPDGTALARRLQAAASSLASSVSGRLAASQQQFGWLQGRLARVHPGQQLEQRMQRLDELDNRLRRGLQESVQSRRARLATLAAELGSQNPSNRIQLASERLATLRYRLQRQGRDLLADRRQRLGAASRALQTVSPLATLDRGYAIARTGEQRLVRSIAAVEAGDSLLVRVQDGEIRSTVVETEPTPGNPGKEPT